MNPDPPPIRKAYVDTSAGQVHLRLCGEGPPLLLLHWVPLSGGMFEGELPVLAGLGWRAIAADCIGFGQSARRPDDFGIEDHAAVLAEVLHALDASEAAVSGGHFSTPIAVALGLREDLNVPAIAIDGGALMPPEAVQALLGRARVTHGPHWQEDGSHRSFLYDQAVNTLSIFAPGLKPGPATLPWLYRFMSDFLATGFPADMGGQAPYDIAAALAWLEKPTLVLTSETEPLRPSFEPLLEAAKMGVGHEFDGDHPLHDPARTGTYARTLDGFFRDKAGLGQDAA